MTLMSLRAALSAVVLAGCTAALTGCGISPESALSSSPETGKLGAINGSAYGGQQPITGAHVYFYSTGVGGYNTNSTSLLTSTSGASGTQIGYDGTNYYAVTDGSGNFFVNTVNCNAGTQAYVYISGGNPGNTNGQANSVAGLLAPLGSCASGSVAPPGVTFLNVNEITTIVTAYALAGYATSPTKISTGGSSLAATGIANAMNTALNMVNLNTGFAPATSYTGNATVPVAEINTLANALSFCVNSNGPTSSGCTSFYSASGIASGTDMAAAAIAIAHAPFTGTKALWTLGSSTSGAFSPSLGTQPADFTLALQYKTPQYTSGGVVNYSLAVDSGGNLWTRGINSAGTSSTFVKYSPLGSASSAITVTTAANINYSSYIHLAIDSTNNVWSGTLGGEVEIPSGATTATALNNNSCAITGSLASTVFGKNGVNYAGDLSGGHIWEFNSTGCIGSLAPPTSTIPGAAFEGYLASESGGGFVASGTDTKNDYVFRYASGATSLTQSYEAGGEFLTTDAAGDVWAYSTLGGSTFDVLNEYNSSNVGLAPSAGYYEGGLIANKVNIRAGTEGVHIDGAGAAWLAITPCVSFGSCSNDVVVGLPANISTSSTAITPTNAGLALPYSETGAHALALDGSGNLWVAVTDGSLIQYVGLTTPVATPTLYGNVGSKP